MVSTGLNGVGCGLAYVVRDAELQVHLERLVVDVVLDGRLALGEGVAALLDRGVVHRGRQLGVELRLEGALGLLEELRARLLPRTELRGRDGDVRAREIADLDLRRRAPE